MELNKLNKIKGSKTKSKRLGRGYGSGKGGHTVGRGTKGQKARTGYKITTGFEGGQVPLYKRIPKVGGFRNPTKKDIININIKDLNFVDIKVKEITAKTLRERGVIKRLPKHGVKILANGEFDKKITLKGFLFSKVSRSKLEKAGITIVE